MSLLDITNGTLENTTTKREWISENFSTVRREDKIVVLVDMDGVIADWQAKFDQLLLEQLPHIAPIPAESITRFKSQSFYAPEHQPAIEKMLVTPGYYRNLKPITGAVEGLKALSEKYEVFLCTAPYISHETCASEKMEWVREHLGNEWLNRTIITSDKTMVSGDFLIDDKPKIKGFLTTPSWEHIVFDAPYNRENEIRIDRWSDAVSVIEDLLNAAPKKR